MISQKRRTIICIAPVALIAVSASPFAAPRYVAETEAFARTLGYVDNTNRVDQGVYTTHTAAQMCRRCKSFRGTASDSNGPCETFDGHIVSASGWCSAFADRAGPGTPSQ